jgi:hypothetical protein
MINSRQSEMARAGQRTGTGDPLEGSRPESRAGGAGLQWADNCLQANDWTDFTLNGDAAPNDRFNHPARLAQRNRAESP